MRKYTTVQRLVYDEKNFHIKILAENSLIYRHDIICTSIDVNVFVEYIINNDGDFIDYIKYISKNVAIDHIFIQYIK